MSLQKRQFGGKEKKVKRKAWRELRQEELVERAKGISEDNIVDTSMASYDPVINAALKQIKFSLYGARRKGHSALLYGNMYRGTDMMYHDIKDGIEILGEANVVLSQHPNPEIREEVLKETKYFKFPISKKLNLKLQPWVPEILLHVSECLDINIGGMYGMSLCYSLHEEKAVSEDYRYEMGAYVKRFRQKIEGKSSKLQILLNHTKNEEDVTT